MPVVDACKWERIEGDPHTVNVNAYTSDDGSKIMGTWICTPGGMDPSTSRLTISSWQSLA
jgi:uncharacterized cupin superfamily protein